MTDEMTIDTEAQDRKAATSRPSERGPDAFGPMRRRSDDPTLGDGAKPPTTFGWAPTPTLTDRTVFQTPAFVVVDGDDDAAARVAEGLERLDRPVERIPAGGHGIAGRSAGPLNHPSVIHVGSTGALREPTAQAVTRTVGAYRPGATVTYDPALRHAELGSPDEVRSRVEGYVRQADVVKVSARDLDRLYPGEEHRDVVRRWLASGPSIVVVSAGAAGTWAVNSIGTTATAAGPGVDDSAPGVGEALMAGVIDALWKGGLLGVLNRNDLRTLVPGSLQELVDNAVAAAAVAHRSGGRPPTRAELAAERGIPQLGAGRPAPAVTA